MQFDKYKFRCSSLSKLMTKSRKKSDPLSQTTKTYLKELWIKEVFGREKIDWGTKYTNKGQIVESDSMDLVNSVTGDKFFKNRDELQNDWITGTPDIIVKEKGVPQSIIDIKSSWDLWTFASVDENKAKKDYFHQLLGYMWLTETKESGLMYCLVNTPEKIIDDELYKVSFITPDSDLAEELYRKNYIFDDIDPKLRIKKYIFKFDSELIEELKEKIKLSREYMNKLSL